MSWKVAILKKAETDLAWFRKNDRTCYLKHFDREVWSRRVSHEHRLVYVVYTDEELIEVVSCRSHYDDLP